MWKYWKLKLNKFKILKKKEKKKTTQNKVGQCKKIVCCTWLDHACEKNHFLWNMKAFKWDPFWRCVLSLLITIVLTLIMFVNLLLPMLLLILDDDGQTLLKWKGGTFAHWYQKLHPWKMFHYAQIPTTKQFTMVFIYWFWRYVLCFVFFL
jgi:hypothetical protein